MTRNTMLWLLIAAAMVIGVAPLGYRLLHDPGPSEAADKPDLLLLTSLPLLFGQGFSLDDTGSPALSALQQRYDVVPISVTDQSELARGKLLLMAHAQAQPPDALVALDQWVRDGGHLLLLADPMLEWPNERPLGDRLRPAAMFMDTELLAHWGLKLEGAGRGPIDRQIGGYAVKTASPGRLSGRCAIAPDRFVARCRIGKGRVTVIADADWLNVDHLEGSANNLNALLAELAALRQQ